MKKPKHKIDQELARLLAPLREVHAALVAGITQKEFDKRFRGIRVSPGSSAHQYLSVLRIAGSLEEDEAILIMKRVKKPGEISVGDFAELIEPDYGPELTQQFVRAFPSKYTVITFRVGLEKFLEIENGTNQPSVPSFGQTNSPSGDDGEVIFEG